MAVKKLLSQLENGQEQYIAPVKSSTGSADAEKIVALNNSGKLDLTMMPDGVGAETEVYPASEALSANDLVNIFDDSGTLKVRKAVASDINKSAAGYVKDNVNSGADAAVYFEGRLQGLTGILPNTTYYLSSTQAGKYTSTPPVADGTIYQPVGTGIKTDQIRFEQGKVILN